jgi:predicted PurR-regulated permease PerM
LLLGAKLGGVLGLITAVPLAGAIKRTAESYRNSQILENGD